MREAGLTEVLRHPVYRNLWVGMSLSNLGTMIQTVGAGWLMATIVASSDMVALVQSATTLPIMLFSILAGVFADSYDRRRVLLVAQVFMLCISATLAVAVTTGWITPWLLLGFTFLLGCGTALHTPSWQACVGDVVPRDEIASAVTLNGMSVNLTRSLGPAIGGMIVAAAGAAAAFAINAVSYLPIIYALSRWRVPAEPPALPREEFHRAVGAGLRYVTLSPNLLKVIGRGFLFGLSAVAVLALLPLVARDLLGGGAVSYGLLLGAFGVGALGGGALNAQARRRLHSEGIARTAFLGFAACALLIAASRSLWLTCIVLLPAGACWVLALSMFNVIVQLSTPRWVVGRTLSIYQTATFGGMTLGGWLWGGLAEAHGVPAAFVLSAGVSLAGALIGLGVAMPDLVSLNLDPLNRFREPHLGMDISPRSGPVRILIEYRVPEDRITAFRDALNARRRMRRRDGARHWSLLRDMEDPTLWTETYQFPTWSDYLRYTRRPTQEDAAISDQLRTMTVDGSRPRIRRMIERHTVPPLGDMVIRTNPEIP